MTASSNQSSWCASANHRQSLLWLWRFVNVFMYILTDVLQSLGSVHVQFCVLTLPSNRRRDRLIKLQCVLFKSCQRHDKCTKPVVYWFMIDGSDRSDCQRDWWSSWATCSSSQHSTWIKGKISKTEIFQFVKLYFYEVDFCIEAFLWIWLNVKSSIFDDIIFLLWVWPIRAQYLYWFKIKCVYENWSVFFWLTPHFVFKSLLTKTNDRCAGE